MDVFAPSPRPAHARDFRGGAKCIPPTDAFLLGYQARWVQDKSLIRLMEKSRRVGISYATAYDETRTHATDDCRIDTWCSSRDEGTALEWIRYVEKFARLLDTAARYLGSAVIDEAGNSAHVCRFNNGTRINSLSSNPNAFAGKGGNVGLDEFALRQDPRLLYDIALPTTDWGGRVSIISTHRGKANFFNRLILDERDPDERKHRGISIHRITLTKALQDGFLWKLQTKLPASDPRMDWDEAEYWNAMRRRASSEERFLQEYECQPEDEDSVFLPYDLLDGSTYPREDDLVRHTEETTDFRGAKGGIRYLLPPGVYPHTLATYLQERYRDGADLYHGKDVARKGDLSVDWIGARVAGIMMTLAVIEFDRVQFSRQEETLYPLLPYMRRSCIDRTGIGAQFAERAAQRFGAYKVEEINFSRGMKEELAMPVRATFEDRACRIPNDQQVIDDFRMIRREQVGDALRFVAEDEDGKADSHADRFWAFALCLHAGKRPGGYTAPAVSQRRSSRQVDRRTRAATL